MYIPTKVLQRVSVPKWIKDYVKREYAEAALLALVAAVFSSLAHLVVEQMVRLGGIRLWFLQHPKSTAFTATVVAVVLASLASYWKQNAQRSYGITEVGFGAALTFNVLLGIGPHFDFSKMFAVGSGIYVITRGFNNLSDARKSRITS